ncbi:MAG: alpha/beta fold hydrolase [Reyranellaceae bacterium]
MTVPPGWFERAIAHEPSSSRIGVDGRSVHYLSWGDKGGEPVLLVHGNGAHARWWSFIAPFLAARGRYVGAIDLGGMGDSDEPPEPGIDAFARQICAVAEAIGAGRPVNLVGHSFGGLVSVAAATRRPELVARLVVIDSPFHIGGRKSHRNPRNTNAVYPDQAAILARFRLLPAQEIEHPCVLDFIARHSIAPTTGGWAWKFRVDPWESPLLHKSVWTAVGQRLGGFDKPATYLRGELSKLCPLEAETVWRQFAGDDAPVIVIPQAHHHVILDQPIAVVSALDTLFSLPPWRREEEPPADALRSSVPDRRSLAATASIDAAAGGNAEK